MRLTADTLQRATGCWRGVALAWAEPLADACRRFEIDTPARLAAFLAQIGHESAGFARLVENLNYSAEGLLRTWPKRFDAATARDYARQPERIANLVYAGRMGNGDSASGDGHRYRGRGLVQLTGKVNYEAMRDLLRERMEVVPDFVASPEAMTEPTWAALSAAAYWHDHDLNGLADAGDYRKLTMRINGALIGYPDRLARYQRARRVLAA